MSNQFANDNASNQVVTETFRSRWNCRYQNVVYAQVRVRKTTKRHWQKLWRHTPHSNTRWSTTMKKSMVATLTRPWIIANFTWRLLICTFSNVSKFITTTHYFLPQEALTMHFWVFSSKRNDTHVVFVTTNRIRLINCLLQMKRLYIRCGDAS